MKKSILILALMLVFAGMLSAVSVVIGTGTLFNSSTSSPTPYGHFYANERDQYLITAGELNAAGGGGGYITSLAFNVQAVNGCAAQPMTIKMGHTALANLTTTFVTGTTLVWSSTSYQPVVGANTHVLSGSGFLWNGTSNLVVEVKYGVPGTYSYSAGVYYTTNANKALYYRSDGTDANTVLTGTLSANRANITFNMAAYVPAAPGPANIVSPLDAATLVAPTASMNWAAGGGAPTGFKFQYGTNPAADNLMPLTDLLTVTTYDPAGLFTYGQTYYWKVVPYNGIGDSPTNPIWSFTIEPNPTISVFPHLQDFGTTTANPFPPLNWKKYSGVLADPSVLVLNGGSWFQDDWLNVTTPANKAAKINIYGTAAQGWIISPPIQMPGTGYQLEFDVAYMAWNGLSTPPVADGTGDRFEVLIGDGTTWAPANIVRSWDNAGGPYVLNNISPAGEHITLNISSYTGVKYVAFYGHNGTVGSRDNDLMIDNVLIRQTPAGAPDPVTLNSPADGATGLLKSGFNLTWTPAMTGGAADYFAVYMSMDEGNLYSDVYFETTGTALNPTSYAGGPSTPITFNYDERWYWTVEAVNGGGSAVVEPARWFEIESDPSITIPHLQPFDALAIPTGWTQTKDGTLTTFNWHASASNMAGGTANEMYYNYQSGIGVSRLITPPINTNGVSEFICEFKHFYDDYGVGITAKLQYSHDLINWFDTTWSIIGGSGNDSGTRTVLLSGLSAPVTYVGWVMDGNCFQMDAWYVDDVSLYIPLNWDVAPVSIDMAEVVTPAAMIPKATIINNAVNNSTFNVRMDIGAWTNTQNVTIAAGASLQVSFASYLPAVYTAETVTVTTLLVGDENLTNNVLTGVLVCLDLDVPAYGDAAYDPGAVLNGPATFNLATPGTITDLPALPVHTNFMPGADWCNGAWNGNDYNATVATVTTFYNIDTVSGTMNAAGTNTNNPGFNGIAYNPNTNVWYGAASTALYTFDPVLGTQTLIGEYGPAWPGLIIGIAYDAFANVLYGVDLGYDALFTISTTTGVATFVGNLGIDLNYAQDCAIDNDTGMLYMAGYTASGGLYWIDTVNGGAYLIGPFQSGAEVTGFAIPWGGLDIPVIEIGLDGTITWPAVVGATGYMVYSSDDPYGTYTFEASTTGLSWLDPAFSEGMKFYVVTASDTVVRNAVNFSGLQNLPSKAPTKRTPASAAVFNPFSK